jgi:hypothetical protein
MAHPSPKHLTREGIEPRRANMDTAKERVEEFLSGTACDPTANPIVEEVLFNHAFKHAIVYASRAIKEQLEGQGLSVTLRYCESPAHGHPLPFIIARDSSGKFADPISLTAFNKPSRDVDVVLVDGSARLEQLSESKPHIKVFSSLNKSNYEERELSDCSLPKNNKNVSRKPASIIIMPASRHII